MQCNPPTPHTHTSKVMFRAQNDRKERQEEFVHGPHEGEKSRVRDELSVRICQKERGVSSNAVITQSSEDLDHVERVLFDVVGAGGREGSACSQ